MLVSVYNILLSIIQAYQIQQEDGAELHKPEEDHEIEKTEIRH